MSHEKEKSKLKGEGDWDKIEEEETYEMVSNPVDIQPSQEELEVMRKEEEELEKLWKKATISSNHEKAKKELKSLIRKGIPDKFRRDVWLSISGAKESLDAGKNLFADAFLIHFNNRMPPDDVKVPTFGGVDYQNVGNRTPDIILNADQIQVWRRIMMVFALEHPEIRTCYVFSDVIAMLSLYLSDTEGYAVAHNLMESSLASNADRRWLFPSIESLTLFSITFSDLIKFKNPKVFKLMGTYGVDCHSLGVTWFSRNFLGLLPYRTALRVFDCWLSEGTKILYRVALAVFQIMKADLLLAPDAIELVSRAQACLSMCTDWSSLLQQAYSMYLSRKHALKYDKKNSGKEQEIMAGMSDVISSEKHQTLFRRPVCNSASAFLSQDEVDRMWSWLPEQQMLRDAKRLFCTSDDGYLLSTLYNKIGDAAPTFIVVSTTKNPNKDGYMESRVFGAFVTSPWKPQRGYYGSGQSFVFSLKPTVRVYPWSHNNDYFQSCNESRLSVGQGFVINADLKGHAQTCSTFNIPIPLAEEHFECAHVEVWTLD